MSLTDQFIRVPGSAERIVPLARLLRRRASPPCRRPKDCESVQFASSLVRDGSDLLIGYGVLDSLGYILPIRVSDAIKMLQSVDVNPSAAHHQHQHNTSQQHGQ